MKGHAGVAAAPGKRRWRFRALLPIVVVSLFVPIAFVLGLVNRIPYGYLVDEQPSSDSAFENYGSQGLVESDRGNVNSVLRSSSKDDVEAITNQGSGRETDGTSIDNDFTSQQDVILKTQPNDVQSKSEDNSSNNGLKNITTQSNGLSTPQVATPKTFPAPNATNSVRTGQDDLIKNFTSDENGKSCQLEFGSYCLWSLEHKEIMIHATVKRLKDQLFVARAYYPSIAKLPGQDNLSHEMKQNIQDHERMLSEAIVDADLPPLVGKKIERMDQVIAKAKSCSVDCNNVDKKLRQILDLTEDEAHFHMKQSAFMFHLGVQTIHKSHHCLSMRLTVEYFKSPPADIEQLHADKIGNPWLRHHVLFSRNILAASVAINSTVMNSEDAGGMVFHVLTDVQNYYAMKLWFARNSHKEATIRVLNFDELVRDQFHNFSKQLSLSEEYRVSIHNHDQPHPAQIRTEYLSVFGSSHFLLPQLFKHLKKLLILDDDVVVQRDLSSLWSVDLGGRVVGSVEYCRVRLDQLKSYLGTNEYIGNSCAWMSGLNIVDLDMWRKRNVSGTYQSLLQKLHIKNEASQKAAELPITLLAFQDLIYPLEDSWALSGLGHRHGVSTGVIENTAVLHYNGNMKPWLELGIPNYKMYWRRYLTNGERFMDECNVSV